MTPKDQYKDAKRMFEGHCEKCERCGQYDGSTGTLGRLCLHGTWLFTSMRDLKSKLSIKDLHAP